MQEQKPQYNFDNIFDGAFGEPFPNCEKTVEEEFVCQCGFRSKGKTFCPNCGCPVATLESFPEKSKMQEPDATSTFEEAELSNLVLIFSISSYMSTNPPINTYTNVYVYSDTQLLLDCNGGRRLISVDVIEPVMEIIRKNRLNDPELNDPSAMAIMGGYVCVGFKEGDRFVRASSQKQGYAVINAQYELMGLFNKA